MKQMSGEEGRIWLEKKRQKARCGTFGKTDHLVFCVFDTPILFGRIVYIERRQADTRS